MEKSLIIPILLLLGVLSLSLLLFPSNYNSFYVNAQEKKEMRDDELKLSINNIIIITTR